MGDGRALQDYFLSFPYPVAMNIVALAATFPAPDESRNRDFNGSPAAGAA
jgi:hypothetical protein